MSIGSFRKKVLNVYACSLFVIEREREYSSSIKVIYPYSFFSPVLKESPMEIKRNHSIYRKRERKTETKKANENKQTK
jgi:hypothetical protein